MQRTTVLLATSLALAAVGGVGMLAVVMGPVEGSADGRARPAVLEAVKGAGASLESDASGPLFEAAALVPGAPVARCLEVTWRELDHHQLGLTAEVDGALASYLDVVVEVGAGGGYDSCVEFAGDVAYTGTLAELGTVASGPAVQVPLLTLAEPDGAAVVRMTVEVRDVDRAQGLTATADLQIGTTVLTGDPGAGTDPSTGPPPPGPSQPVGTPPEVEGSRPTASRPTAPPPSGPPASAPSAPADAGRGSGEVAGSPPATSAPGPSLVIPLTRAAGEEEPAAPGPFDWLRELLAAAADLLRRSTHPVAEGLWWASWSLPLLLLFLLVQNRIDSRDPKLAEAPAHHTPLLAFDESYEKPVDQTDPGGRPPPSLPPRPETHREDER